MQEFHNHMHQATVLHLNIRERVKYKKLTGYSKGKGSFYIAQYPVGVRKRVLQCYIEPILLYGCESWSMTKQTLTSIEAMEMWFLRRMLRVSWTEKRTNLEILNTAGSTRKLISNIKRRQAEFLGHVMRKGKLEHLLTTGKIEGKRSRGRQRIKIQDGMQPGWEEALRRCLWMQEIAKSGRS